jgi:hypothetical protein
MGRRFFIVPLATLPQVPLLRQLAAASKQDRAARAALSDFLEEGFEGAFGARRPALARVFAGACAESPGKHAAVPGGDLEAPPPPEARVTTLARLRQATTKLSKLQRSLLHFARDYDGDWRGAPMSLMRGKTPSDAAALSRAVRRLEGRKLLHVQRTAGGRATYIRLTFEGRSVTEQC